MGQQAMRSHVFLTAAAIAIVALLTSEVEAAEATAGTGAAGTIGCRYWRMRSITKAVGQYWQVSQFQLFESADGSGAETKGKAIASTHKGKPAVGSGLPDTSETKAEKAMDGNLETFWSASSDLKFEWLGVEFEEPKDIRSIKVQLADWMMGPTMVIMEKSFDGEDWSRVVEISDMKEWGKKLQDFPLLPMDTVPKSVFAMRSQKDPSLCVGVKPTPNAEDPKADPFPIFENAELQIQKCDDNKNTQYWQLVNGQHTWMLNAADQSYKLHVDKAENGGKLVVKQCKEKGDCVDDKSFANDKFQFGAEAKGGIMMGKGALQNLVFTAAKLEANAAVTLAECTAPPPPPKPGKAAADSDPADITKCDKLKDKTLSQFELKPMFTLEKGKQTVSCAPYSHSHKKPSPCENRVSAQEMCAKDNNCAAYNWVSDGDKKEVYLCTDLHEVHSGVAGWELGVRAGRLEPFVEEAKQTKEL